MIETCCDCDEPATCAYGLGGLESFACDVHNPLRMPFGVAVAIPAGWSYRTLITFPMLATTGHLLVSPHRHA